MIHIDLWTGPTPSPHPGAECVKCSCIFMRVFQHTFYMLLSGENELWLNSEQRRQNVYWISDPNIKQQKTNQTIIPMMPVTSNEAYGFWNWIGPRCVSLSHPKQTAPGFVWKRTKTTSPAGPWSAPELDDLCSHQPRRSAIFLGGFESNQAGVNTPRDTGSSVITHSGLVEVVT